MSRTMPYDCPHGVTVDWGDFGDEGIAGDACAECGIDATPAHDAVKVIRDMQERLDATMSYIEDRLDLNPDAPVERHLVKILALLDGDDGQ